MDNFGRAATRRGQSEVVGELHRLDCQASVAQVFESLADPLVQPHAASKSQLAADGLAGEGVAESVSTDPDLVHQSCRYSLLEVLQEQQRFQPGDPLHGVESELLAERGRGG